ncbi:MAG: DUF6212 domain-containing protein [Paracoccaceae bacterium]
MERDPSAFENRGYLVVSAEPNSSLPYRDFDAWLVENKHMLVSPLPLGLILDQIDTAKVEGDLRANIDAAEIPLHTVNADQDVGALSAKWAIDALCNATKLLGDTRRSLAEIRTQHELVQRNFVEAKAWLNNMLAPKFSLVRAFPRASGYVHLRKTQTLRQALPCSSRGLAAIDIFVGEVEGHDAPRLSTRLVRWNGDTIAEFCVEPFSPKGGWLRLPLSQAVSGDDEDCILEIQCRSGVAEIWLAKPVPFEHLRASMADEVLAAPLALKVWGGLPGVSLPRIGHTHATLSTDKATYLTAADLPKPAAFIGSVSHIAQQGSFELRPDIYGKALIVLNDIALENFCNVEAFLQFLGDAGAIVTFSLTAPGVIKSASDSYRLPQGNFLDETQFVRLADHAHLANVDIVLRLENAHPGAALKLWALKLARDIT